jgi:ferredoxin
MAKKISVDQDICISCELCVTTAPGVFRMNEDNVAEVYDAEGDSEDLIQEAIDSCPVACIHWD